MPPEAADPYHAAQPTSQGVRLQFDPPVNQEVHLTNPTGAPTRLMLAIGRHCSTEFSVIIDPGCSHSIMHYGVFQSIPPWARTNIYPVSRVSGQSASNATGTSASGHAMAILGFATFRLRILYQNRTAIHTVEVLVSKNLDPPMLLGQDLIGCYFRTINYEDPSKPVAVWRDDLPVEDIDYPPRLFKPLYGIPPARTSMHTASLNTSSPSDSPTPSITSLSKTVYLGKAKVIPPRSSRTVHLSWSFSDLPSEQRVILEPSAIESTNGPHQASLEPLLLVVGTKHPSAIRVELYNPSDTMLVLAKGTAVATLEPAISAETYHPQKPFDVPSPTVFAVTESGASSVHDAAFGTKKPPQINPLLDEHQRVQLETLLKRHDRVFAEDNATPPVTPLVQHHIDVGDARPIKQQPRRLNPIMLEKVREMVKTYQNAGLIRESESPWASPIVIAKKSDGSIRLCVDYRKLNSVTCKNAYPIPRTEDILRRIQRAKYITRIDLAAAYHQIAMDPKSIPLTAFCTPDGFYEWLRMPFGLTNAPASFQALMNKVFRDHKNVLVYLDDIIIFSDTWSQHVENIENVLETLHISGLSAKAGKCKFGYHESEVFGFIVGNDEMKPDPKRVEAIRKMPAPTDVSTLRTFLGIVNYYRVFIPDMAMICIPLYNLLKKDVVWSWTPACHSAFTQLLDILSSDKVLRGPDFKLPFILQCDASQQRQGIAVVLSQIDQNNVERPVLYLSRKLTKAECNYNITELECLAVVWGCEQCHVYLVGNPFIIQTDHKALESLKTIRSSPPVNQRVLRWALRLAEYDYTIRHRPGKANANCDTLSRFPVGKAEPITDDEYIHAAVTQSNLVTWSSSLDEHSSSQPSSSSSSSLSSAPVWLTMDKSTKQQTSDDTAEYWNLDSERELDTLVILQQNDSYFAPIRDYLVNKVIPAGILDKKLLLQRAKNFILGHKNVLLRVVPASGGKGRASGVTNAFRICIPEVKVKEILEMYHNNPLAGHMGINRTAARIISRYWWPSMWNDIERHINSCEKCQFNKLNKHRSNAPQQSLPAAEYPFEFLSIDTLGPFNTVDGLTVAIVIMDRFTRWAIAVPVPDQTAETVARVLLDHVVTKHGVPRRILSDQGSNYAGKLMGELYALMGVTRMVTSAYHPQANGLVERFNRTLVQILRSLCDIRSENWPEYVQLAVFAYNTSEQESLETSPFYLVYGREPNMPGDELLKYTEFHFRSTQDYINVLKERLSFAHSFVKLQMEELKLEQQKKNEKLKDIIEFNVGDLVLLKVPQLTKEAPLKKGSPLFTGPYRILAKHGKVNYRIKLVNATSRRDPPFTVHVSRLKHYQSSDMEDIKSSSSSPVVSAPAPPDSPLRQPDSGSAGLDTDKVSSPAPLVPTSPRRVTRAQTSGRAKTYTGQQ